MKLSKRLYSIASLISKGAKVYDVGADHGLLERYLLDNNLVSTLVAVENKKGPYQILLDNLNGYNLNIYLADGLANLDNSIDTIVLAGLGGNAIKDIINKDNHIPLINVNKIIIDAHRDKELIKRYIVSLGYKIEKEILVYENNIYYSIISFIKGEGNYSLEEYEYGYNIKSDPLFKDYCTFERNKILNVLAKKDDNDLKEKLVRLNKYEHD